MVFVGEILFQEWPDIFIRTANNLPISTIHGHLNVKITSIHGMKWSLAIKC